MWRRWRAGGWSRLGSKAAWTIFLVSSGGQQQRVAIARALVNNPKILLADEPTGALDTRTTAEIMQLFCDLNEEGITVIVVTHEADVAEYTRRKIVFRDGCIVEDRPQSGFQRRAAE